jgi:hypothetical protein
MPGASFCWLLLRPQINAAGISTPVGGAIRVTPDGLERTLAAAYFGPCYLTLLLQVRHGGRGSR